MRPLIPRVRVGDILKGTRNLRNYLQTAATLAYVIPLSKNYVGSLRQEECDSIREKLRNYRPSKDDEFLVTVNAWNMLGAYDVSSGVVLLFCNTTRTPSRQPSAHSSAYAYFKPRMDPTIFSRWFIRTHKKRVSIATWPKEPYYMWAALHLNLSHIRKDTHPSFHFPDQPEDLFIPEPNSKRWKRSQLIALLYKWRTRGITRSFSQGKCDQSSGPRLEEIETMRELIGEICANPRVAQRVKADSNQFWLLLVLAAS